MRRTLVLVSFAVVGVIALTGCVTDKITHSMRVVSITPRDAMAPAWASEEGGPVISLEFVEYPHVNLWVASKQAADYLTESGVVDVSVTFQTRTVCRLYRRDDSATGIGVSFDGAERERLVRIGGVAITPEPPGLAWLMETGETGKEVPFSGRRQSFLDWVRSRAPAQKMP